MLKTFFENLLKNIDGSFAAFVMSQDGIPIDELIINEGCTDCATAAAEFGSIMQRAITAMESMQSGNLNEMTINSDNLVMVLRPVNSEMYAAIMLNAKGNLGKARFLLKMRVGQIEKALLAE